MMNNVHIGGECMNTGVTSKEAIMQVCRQIVAAKGLPALNMRLVADECHIALGTLYNYYSDKNELLIATVESIWKDIFHTDQKCENSFSFPEYVEYIFECIQKGAKEYPNFFSAHSIGIANSRKGEAKSTMEHYFAHMKKGMLEILEADSAVDKKAFNESFTESEFIDFVLDNIVLLLMQGKTSCSALVKIIQRVLYL